LYNVLLGNSVHLGADFFAKKMVTLANPSFSFLNDQSTHKNI